LRDLLKKLPTLVIIIILQTLSFGIGALVYEIVEHETSHNARSDFKQSLCNHQGSRWCVHFWEPIEFGCKGMG